MKRIRTAFVLGAGIGKRLRPLTEKVPKPLLKIGGRPIITYALDHLISLGIERFIVNTHHCPAEYQKEFPDWEYRGKPILFRHEPVLLETGGGLKNIEDLLEGDDAIFVYNGDILTDIDLKPLREEWERSTPEACLALRSSGHLLNVELDDSGAVVDMRGLLGRSGSKKCQFTGIYIVGKTFLRRLAKDRIESVVPAMVRAIEAVPGSVRGVVLGGGYWHDIGSVAEYERVNRELG
jgi:mannose-1-phosphate guanylyltransferase